MRSPLFTETLQIAIVVRDLEATMRRYRSDYGIGPWDVQEFNSREVEEFREHGEPVECAWRLATTMVGQVQWELIEPLDNESGYARFLAEKGEGVHHVAVAAANFDEVIDVHVRRGRNLALECRLSDVHIAYLPTEGALGVLTEIFADRPGRSLPDAV
jgi:methylmalonyl-CoA/ethylmalonyl-CoA epimerase